MECAECLFNKIPNYYSRAENAIILVILQNFSSNPDLSSFFLHRCKPVLAETIDNSTVEMKMTQCELADTREK